uniref:Rab-GAP TBC domain-containing protein n=1 Tax=Arcella intermedia TaxID=1963864 RepID=A0A6B2L8H4_9EUKA
MLDTDEILTTSPTLPQIEREKPLSELEWKNAFDKDGKIVDPKAIKKRIFYGGVEDSIRIEVWKFLLGYYTWESTETERKLIREQKHQNYDIVRNQWQSIIPDQEKNFSKFRNRRSKIERDVVRTDRSDPNFESLESQYIIWLRKILITYCFFNWDIGYVQGMNDLVAVILVIQNDEADGFWCFKGMMDKFGKHFSKDQNGILTQLEKLRKLMSFLDPQFYKYLGDIDALKFFFVYRWILIVFRREFSLEQVKILWEAILTDYYHKDFMLFFATAILMKEKERIISEGMNFDSILKVYLSFQCANLTLFKSTSLFYLRKWMLWNC